VQKGEEMNDEFNLERWATKEKYFVSKETMQDFTCLIKGRKEGFAKAQEQLGQRDREIAEAAWNASELANQVRIVDRANRLGLGDGTGFGGNPATNFNDYWASLKKEPNDK